MTLTSKHIADKETVKLTFFHGGYYFLSGLWPLVHMQSFLFVTGPKTDLWLVKTVGILLLIGTNLLVAAYHVGL